MSKQPRAKKRNSTLILAWIIPLIAFYVSYEMLKKHYEKQGGEITIYVKDIKNLDIRKSHIEYKGVKIGNLTSIVPDRDDMSRFKVDAMIYSEFDYMVKDGSKFWIVEPKVSLQKIENIGTILTGNYIEIQPPSENISVLKSLPTKRVFTALDTKPLAEGKIIDISSKSGDISSGAKVIYNGVSVGEILSKSLIDSAKVEYKILIYKKYQNLINDTTLFYQNLPIDFKLSATDLSLKVTALKEFLSGTISFVNDENIKDKDTTILYSSIDDLYYDDRVVKLILADNQEYNYIYYNGEKVAKVVSNHYDSKKNKKVLDVKFKSNYIYLLKESPSFYTKAEKLDIEKLNIKDMIKGTQIVLYTKNKSSSIKSSYVVRDIDTIEQRSSKLITLEGNLNLNEKIYYKDIEVGYIKKVYLKNGKKYAKANIYKEYISYINSSTMFYKLNDIDANISLDGLKLKVPSLKQLYYGGISFESESVKNSRAKKLYKVYDSKDSVDTLKSAKSYFYITLTTDNAYNIKKTSKLYYKGIAIADIESIELRNDIVVKLKVKNEYKRLFGSSAKIYLEGMKISLDNIKNMDSAILGDKLHLVSSIDKGFKDNYKLDSINPNDTKYKDGLRVKLIHTDSKNISIDTPIYYNYYKIGKVEDIKLNTKTKNIEYYLYIDKEYANLVKDTSKFSKTKLIDIKLSILDDTKVDISTIESLLKGGIDITSPKEYTRLAKDGDIYNINIVIE